MKTGKTPYEIRLDLLILAHKVLTQKIEAEAGQRAMDSNSDKVIITSAPTTAEVISEAQRLNGFVSGN
jgi:hypothetical protein